MNRRLGTYAAVALLAWAHGATAAQEIVFPPASERLALVTELVTTYSEQLFDPVRVAAADGIVWVTDRVEGRVVVYNEDGTVRGFLGQPGQGPGEFEGEVGSIAVSDNTVCVAAEGRSPVVRFSRASSEPLSDLRLTIGPYVVSIGCLDDGSILLRHLARRFVRVDLFDAEGALIAVLSKHERDSLAVSTYRGREVHVVSNGLGAATVSPRGEIYVSDPTEYEVRKYDARGALLWKIRALDQRALITEADRERYVKLFARGRALQWRGEYFQAIRYLAVDGQGRLFVYRHRPAGSKEPYLVDIFDPDGRLLRAVTLDRVIHATWDEYVYVFGEDLELNRTVEKRRIEW